MIKISDANVLIHENYFKKIIRLINNDPNNVNLKSKIYSIKENIKSYKKRKNELIKKTTSYFAGINADEIVFFLERKTNWLKYSSLNNEADELNETYNYLHKKFKLKKFNGVFLVGNKSLEEFILNIIPLIVYEASLPVVYFACNESDYLFSICRYLNLHVYSIKSEIKIKSKLTVIESC
jgi:hypothetical protein